ncbi:hypothetical protein BDV96DRAFT_571691 [Lophiotrema nucula]|uniref:Uncharacterized protein n=1 Tax=Lophiotrema nucula TaxID=690887 RepID=A0A6A5ZCH8_9PLEO|nr:hypothetical protein BDV96DRAFT_571691 [Lophiotrema nucula]
MRAWPRSFERYYVAGEIISWMRNLLPRNLPLFITFEDISYTEKDIQAVIQDFEDRSPGKQKIAQAYRTCEGLFPSNIIESTLVVSFSAANPYRQILADIYLKAIQGDRGYRFPLAVICQKAEDNDKNGRNETSDRVVEWLRKYDPEPLAILPNGNNQIGHIHLFTRQPR